MLLTYLQRVPEFTALPAAELKALAQQTVVVCVPAGRQLVTPGIALDDYLFLLRGTLSVDPARRRVRASRFGVLRHFYPGASAVRAHTACQIARVRRQLYEFVSDGGSGGARYDLDAAPWLKRFLSSHMMRQLSNAEWQALLRGFVAERFARGDRVIAAGTRGECCYVVEAGHAVVHHCGKTLCHLNPGDFFGEDALLVDAPRNATVTALSPLKVQKIHRQLFLTVLADTLVEFVEQRGPGVCYSITDAAHIDLRATLAELPARQQIYVTGGSRAERALVTFLLVQRGHRAQALA